ncbi:MAG: HAD-IA family hydrolase, partial [Clostridia bacterium]
LTSQEINNAAMALTAKLYPVREMGFELHEGQFQRLLYESLGIELSLSYEGAERVFWDAMSTGDVMPGAREMVEEINARNIRSGVISNIMFSGKALAARIDRLLPNNRFECILASSEYGVRKPNRMLFDIALCKANLDARDVWFVGDNPQADVEGAAEAGMFPVWYEEKTIENPWCNKACMEPTCRHAHIHCWNDLILLLDEMK